MHRHVEEKVNHSQLRGLGGLPAQAQRLHNAQLYPDAACRQQGLAVRNAQPDSSGHTGPNKVAHITPRAKRLPGLKSQIPNLAVHRMQIPGDHWVSSHAPKRQETNIVLGT